MSQLLPYLITNITLVLTGFATLSIALALVSARRARVVQLRRRDQL